MTLILTDRPKVTLNAGESHSEPAIRFVFDSRGRIADLVNVERFEQETEAIESRLNETWHQFSNLRRAR